MIGWQIAKRSARFIRPVLMINHFSAIPANRRRFTASWTELLARANTASGALLDIDAGPLADFADRRKKHVKTMPSLAGLARKSNKPVAQARQLVIQASRTGSLELWRTVRSEVVSIYLLVLPVFWSVFCLATGRNPAHRVGADGPDRETRSNALYNEDLSIGVAETG